MRTRDKMRMAMRPSPLREGYNFDEDEDEIEDEMTQSVVETAVTSMILMPLTENGVIKSGIHEYTFTSVQDGYLLTMSMQ